VSGKFLPVSKEMKNMATNGSPVSYALVLLFLVLLVAGINAGEASAVWEKAITICLSCIGAG